MKRPKPAQLPKVLPQKPTEEKAELAPTSAPPDRDPLHIFKNERGELAISQAGSIRVTQTFLGSNAQTGQDNTALDNARFAQVTCALPQSKGKCDEPQLLNIALDGVAALIAKVRKATSSSRRELVNAALRDGLVLMLEASAPRTKFRTTVHSSGRCYLPNLNNTAEVLATAEGECFK